MAFLEHHRIRAKIIRWTKVTKNSMEVLFLRLINTWVRNTQNSDVTHPRKTLIE
jgi:hypothetical protein